MAAMSKISAVFAADTGGLELGVKRAGLALRNMGADVASLRSRLGTLTAIQGAQLFGNLVSYASQATRSLVEMAKSTADSVDKMSKLSQSTGTTYAEFAGLASAGELAGIGVDLMASSLQKADKVFVAAQQGSKSAKDAFAAIGLSVDQLIGKTSAERFELLAESINSLPDPAQKTAAAMAIFGRSGAQLLPMFAGGAKGIQAAREEAERFGLALSNTQATNVEAMNDAWTRVLQAVRGVVTQVVGNLAPAVKAVYDTLSNFISDAGGANIGENITEAFFAGAKYLAGVIDYTWEKLNGAWEYAKGVIDYFSTVSQGFGVVSSAFSAVFNAFQGIIAGAIGAIAKLAQKLAETAATAAEFLGFDGTAAKIRATANAARILSEEQFRAAGNELGQAAKDAADAWYGRSKDMSDALERPVGRFEGFVDRIKAESDAAKDRSADEAAKAVAVAGDLAADKISQAYKSLSAIDARSGEGINTLIRLSQQRPDTEQKKQTNLLGQIANNTKDRGDIEELDI